MTQEVSPGDGHVSTTPAQSTPGPWVYRHRMVVGDNGDYVCEVSGGALHPAHQADARLIAAAPDLLAAARSVLGQFDAGYFVRNTDGDGSSDWAFKAAKSVAALASLAAAIKLAEEGSR